MTEVWNDNEKVAAGNISSITATGDEYMVVFFGSYHLDIPRRDAERIAEFVNDVSW